MACFAQRGHFTDGTSSSATSLVGMDAACLRDLTTTANLKGNLNGDDPSQMIQALGEKTLKP